MNQNDNLMSKHIVQTIYINRAVVAERSNASVYLMIDTLELKVEGSNPGVAVYFSSWKAQL